MAIWDNKNTDLNVPVIEGYTSGINGDVIAHQEFMIDMVAVHESMHTIDMLEVNLRKNHGGATLESVMESAGSEYSRFEIALEGAMSNMWEKMKYALKKLWAKIKGFFKSIRKYFDYLIMDGTKFAKKYEKEIRRKSGLLGGFEVSMFDYDDAKIDDLDFKVYNKLDVALPATVSAANAESVLNNYFKDADTIEEQVLKSFRAKLVGGNGSKDDWTEELFGYFRNGAKDASDKKDNTSVDINEMCKVLINTKIVSKLLKLEKEMDNSFKAAIKDIDTASKAATDSKLIQVYGKKNGAIASCHAIGTSFIKGWEKAAKERNRTYKTVIIKALAYKEKNN